jgi:hypothetical protein
VTFRTLEVLNIIRLGTFLFPAFLSPKLGVLMGMHTDDTKYKEGRMFKFQNQ